ncbi:MAG: hypothetical protein WC208_10510 [Gallionella sp.]|jgi:hypothetical protein
MALIIASNSKFYADRAKYPFCQQPVVSYGSNLKMAAHISDINNLEIHNFNGSDWLIDKTYTDTAMDNYSLCRSELNDVFLTYKLNATSPYTIKVKKRDHTSGLWTEVYSVSAENATYSTVQWMTPMITYNRLINRLHLFWFEMPYVNPTTIGPYRLKNIFSDDKGATWSAINIYNMPSGGSGWIEARSWTTLFSLDSSPTDGSLYLSMAYGVYVGIAYSWYYIWKFTSSGIYSTDYYAPGGGADLHNALIAVDSAGNIYDFNYSDSGATDTALCRKNGVSIVIGLSTVKGAYYHQSFALGIDNTDSLYVFYTKTSDGIAYWKMYNPSTSTWSTELPFTSGMGKRVGCELHAYPASTKLNIVYYTSA